MASLTLRSVKGTPLTFAEMDDNFSNLNNEGLVGVTLSGTTLQLDRAGSGSTLTRDLRPIVTYEALNLNSDVGTGSNQVARGDHTHSQYALLSGDTFTGNVTFNASFGNSGTKNSSKVTGNIPLDGALKSIYIGTFRSGLHRIEIHSFGNSGYNTASYLIDFSFSDVGTNNTSVHSGVKVLEQYVGGGVATEFLNIHSRKISADKAGIYLEYLPPTVASQNQTLTIKVSSVGMGEIHNLTETEGVWILSASDLTTNNFEASKLLEITTADVLNWRGNTVYHSGNLSLSTLGGVPTSRTINGQSLANNITLTAADVGALPSTTTLSTLGGVPTSRTISTNNGLTGGGDLSANRTFGLTGQALALHNLATSGLITRTGSGTVAGRTITAGNASTIITNGNGVSGNPTISVNVTASPGDTTTDRVWRTNDLVKTTSYLDQNAGRIPQFFSGSGILGLGSTSAAYPAAGESLNNADRTMFLNSADVSPTGWDSSLGSYPMGFHIQRSSVVQCQLAVGYTGKAGYRTKTGTTTWSNWRHFYDNENPNTFVDSILDATLTRQAPHAIYFVSTSANRTINLSNTTFVAKDVVELVKNIQANTLTVNTTGGEIFILPDGTTSTVATLPAGVQASIILSRFSGGWSVSVRG